MANEAITGYFRAKGGYLFDTANPGNSNKGHEFQDGPKGNGVIGPALSPDDRWAIIEYLKVPVKRYRLRVG